MAKRKRKSERAEDKAWVAISRYCPEFAGKRKKINMKKCRAALGRFAKARAKMEKSRR